MRNRLELLGILVFLLFVNVANASVSVSYDSIIFNNRYIQDYDFRFNSEQVDREFVWYIINFEKLRYEDIDKVIISGGYTNRVYSCEYYPSISCDDEVLDFNYTGIILSGDDLAYSLPKKYFLVELKMPLDSNKTKVSESFIRVETYYKEGYKVKAYSPVRVESYMATDGTDVCDVIQESNNAQLEFDGGTIFRHAVNIAIMNIELIKIMFWLFKILIFMVALGAIFYMFLIIVKLIKGEGHE